MTTGTVAVADDAGGRSYGTPAYRGFVLILLTLVYTLNFIDRNLLSVIAQPVITAFNLSDSEYGFLNGPPFAIFYALMGIPIAIAADRYNRVVIIAICIAIWSLMAALCGFATSFMFLLVARIGVAIGEAGCTPPANSIIGDYFKPGSRANALGIYAMGVTIGAALANAFGGPIATGLSGTAVEQWLQTYGMAALFPINWADVEGWRVAFVVIGAPGLIVALIVLFTIKEPPRGFSDPPAMERRAGAGLRETLRELSSKPTFWVMALGAALTALVGYGLAGFQAPMAQRIHGISPGQFALEFGVPLSLCAAAGTFIGGYATEKLSPRYPTAVAWLPALGLLLSIPFYLLGFFTPTARIFDVGLVLWGIAATLHFTYLGAQYTIGQGVVSTRSRASAIAILLLIVALIGNGLGPLIVGWLSDMFMSMQLAQHGMEGTLTNEMCRSKDLLAQMPEAQRAICTAAYGEGLRQSMAVTALFFIPAAACFWLSSRTYSKDLVARG
ncbi:MAG: MFS transporter [Alphaproteobacteria bacterium]|nr:MFS transporter [Alphaproteobacteria bacterium]